MYAELYPDSKLTRRVIESMTLKESTRTRRSRAMMECSVLSVSFLLSCTGGKRKELQRACVFTNEKRPEGLIEVFLGLISLLSIDVLKIYGRLPLLGA